MWLVTAGRAPVGVAVAVQYGPNTAAIATYLYAGQFLSKQRTAQALSELFGTALSAGTVSAFTKRCGRDVRASGALERIRAGIATAAVANFDETGLRVEGRLHWVHSASTDRWSLLTVHPKRGTAGIDHAGVMPVSPCMTRGRRMTPTTGPPTRCAARTCNVNSSPCSTRPRKACEPGPARPTTHYWTSRPWSRMRKPPATPASTPHDATPSWISCAPPLSWVPTAPVSESGPLNIGPWPAGYATGKATTCVSSTTASRDRQKV